MDFSQRRLKLSGSGFEQIYVLTLHKKNSTGRKTATAIVMGINQLSSEAYGSFTFGPEVCLNFCCGSASSGRSESSSLSP